MSYLPPSRPLGAATYTYLYAARDVADALRRLAVAQLSLVEFTAAPPHVQECQLDAGELRRIRRVANRLGLQLISLNPTYLDLNLASLNKGIREESLHQLTSGLQLCHDLEIGILVLFAGRRHVLAPAPFDLVEGPLLDGLTVLLDRAATLGVTVGLENGPTLMLDRGADVARVCTTLRHKNLGAVFDAANSYMVEDPAEGLRAVLPHTVLVHLSDTTRTRWAHAPVGRGTVDFDAISVVLDEASYSGPTILEVIDLEDPSGGLTSSAARLALLGWSTDTECTHPTRPLTSR